VLGGALRVGCEVWVQLDEAPVDVSSAWMVGEHADDVAALPRCHATSVTTRRSGTSASAATCTRRLRPSGCDCCRQASAPSTCRFGHRAMNLDRSGSRRNCRTAFR
jgi:hypothetical protein